MYYLNSRYYDPEIGRFINADDIAVLDLTNIAINGLNLYAYCLNNPVNEVDENGYIVWWIAAIIAVFVTTGVAVGVSIGVQLATTGKINGRQLFFDAIMGALSGLLMFTGLGPLGMALWNGALSFFASVGSQLESGVKLTEINWLNVLGATVLGVIAGSKGAIRNTQNFQKALNAIDDVKYAKANRIFLDKETYDKILESNKKKAVKGLVLKNSRSSVRFGIYNFLNGIIFQ